MAGHFSAWKLWVPRLGTLSATITTLCCLGVGAAISLTTAVGATFLTSDAVLRPLLAATLLLTVLGSALTWRAHRNPLPLMVTAAAGAWVFIAIFGSDLFAHGSGEDGHGTGHSVANPGAWAGLAVLIATQLWDVFLVRSKQNAKSPSVT